MNAQQSLDEHLQPGETLAWQTRPGAAPISLQAARPSLRFGAVAAVIGTTLAGLGEVPPTMLPVVFVVVTIAIALLRWRTDRLSPGRIYGVTDRRVLIVDGRSVRAFGPDDIPYLDVQTQDDGTVDLVWGEDRRTVPTSDQSSRSSTGPFARATFLVKQRKLKRGLLGLPSAEPARSMINHLTHLHRQAVASSVPDAPPPSMAAADGPGTTADGWRTVRQPDLGFAIELPTAWRVQTARVKLYRFLGIPFEPAPRWSETPQAGWNRLTVDSGLEAVALQVTLNPERFPADLPEVLSDRWAKALNLRTLDSSADVRIGGLSGFSVDQNLEGVGVKVSLGPVTVSGGAVKAQLMQKQIWLRGPGITVHVHCVMPSGDASLSAAMERIVRTLRIER